MVEVDLRLFVTCRLCLDVQGHFQIDPNVQQQIKYCFDIEVEPFDGLPQLICKKCENILREHYAIKKNFTDKQKELKTKLEGNSPSPQKDETETDINKTKPSSKLDDSDSSVEFQEKTTRKKKKVKKKRIVKKLMLSSCDDSEPNEPAGTKIDAAIKKDSCEEPSWDANLNKYFVCRICSQGFQDKEDITKHIKEHSHLQIKYKNIFKMSCSVVIERSDNKPNLCNSNEAVVYSSDSIIQNKHNPFYYIKYHPKSYSCIPSTFKYMSKANPNNSESTDNEIPTRKRRRLLSRSSSETVVINRHSEHEETSHITENNNNPPTVIDCIDLGDSSDNGSCKSNEKRNSLNKLVSKSMHNIIKMCHNKYNKQIDSVEKKTSRNNKGKEDVLQHKVLSIGRKIINNKGFYCTGLLRYLEYKNLSVIWKETSVLNPGNDGKYVRIATRFRGNEISDTNKTGWKNFSLFKFENEEIYNSVNVLKKLKTFENFKKKLKVKSVVNKEENVTSVENLPRISSVFSHTDLEITKADPDNLLLQKLLNKNPVSNPKQLPKKNSSNDKNLVPTLKPHPKKVNSDESCSKNMKVFSAPNTVPFVRGKEIETNNGVDTNPMPRVTSTISLAQIVEKENKVATGDSVNSSNNQQPTYPRIKVKPVSELMPEKTTNVNSNDTYTTGVQNASHISSVIWTNDTRNNQQTWPTHVVSTVIVASPQTWQKQNDCFIDQSVWHTKNISFSENDKTLVNNTSQGSKTSDSAKEYILLDTVEFPNTKTTSPFQYLKNLLLLHNITLLDFDQPLPAGSVCLIKLKLIYQQEKCMTVNLCLSLFCLKNVFCIQVKDANLKDVHVNNLSPNWQWQLLKIFNNDIIPKVLQTAAKVSPETYQHTQRFLALLKSIKSKTDTV